MVKVTRYCPTCKHTVKHDLDETTGAAVCHRCGRTGPSIEPFVVNGWVRSIDEYGATIWEQGQNSIREYMGAYTSRIGTAETMNDYMSIKLHQVLEYIYNQY